MKYNNVPLYESKVIFFLSAKAASSSIKTALAEHLGLSTKLETVHRQHEKISPCEAAELKGFAKIAVIRNPWARVVSVYYEKIIGSGKSSLLRLGFYKGMTFEEFVRKVHAMPNATEAHIRGQTAQMFCDGAFVPDQVIRVENLPEEWAKVQALVPLPDLKQVNISNHPPYRECYTLETRQLVFERYMRDIEVFGYEF